MKKVDERLPRAERKAEWSDCQWGWGDDHVLGLYTGADSTLQTYKEPPNAELYTLQGQILSYEN